MKKHNKSERGQALVLIVFAIIGLIGMTGLTVDGGMAFSDRRNAQNAADTAALAAARALIRNDGVWDDSVRDTGLGLAQDNGYDNNGTTNTVEIIYPHPELGDEYILVNITSHYQTSFARVMGISQMTNQVFAVARVIPTQRVNMFDGNAVIGLDPHGCKAIKYDGNAGTNVVGGGIFVNSDCDNGAYFSNTGAALLDGTTMCVVGDADNSGGAFTGTISEGSDNCEPYEYPVNKYVMPDPECAGPATVNGNTMSPGEYSGTFPPPGVDTLLSGVYCITGDFRMNGGDSLTGTNVVIHMRDGDVSWQGGEVILDAPDDGPFKGLVLYMPYDNEGDIINNGNVYVNITGTILAPAADVQVNGTAGGPDDEASIFNGQIIGYKVDISGTSGMTINYDDELNYEAETPPYLQLTE